MGLLPLVEIAFGLYFSCMNYYAFSRGIYGVMPFLCLFQFGYLYTGIGSLLQGIKQIPVPLPKLLFRFRWVFSKEGFDPKPEF
jgi:hypothetical protein